MIRRVPFLLGVIMIIIGLYSFWWYFELLIFGDIIEQLSLWIAALVIAVLLTSFGPGVMVWAYGTSYQSSLKRIAKQNQWQVIQIPLECSECGNAISFRTLEWIGDEEVRCPFCSKDLEIRTSRSYM